MARRRASTRRRSPRGDGLHHVPRRHRREKVQVWTIEPNPECISEDARLLPRTKPTLARRKEDVDTPFKAWYNAAVSHEMFDAMEQFFNQRLDGRTPAPRCVNELFTWDVSGVPFGASQSVISLSHTLPADPSMYGNCPVTDHVRLYVGSQP